MLETTWSVLCGFAVGLLVCVGNVLRADEADRADLEQRLAAALARCESFSGVVLVREQQQVLLFEARGHAGAGQALTTAALFDIGSVSKPLAAVATLRLAAARRLDLDATLDRLLAAVPPAYAKATLRQLLCHSAGLSASYQTLGATREELVAAALALPVAPAPTYSNLSTMLVAAILERAMGQDYETIVQREVFTPLRLPPTAVGFCGQPQLDRRRDAGRHQAGRELGSMIDHPYGWGFRGATGAIFDAESLARFVEGALAGDLLPAAFRELQTKPVAQHYALGWQVLEQRGPLQICHGGSSAGARALVSYFPQTKTTIVVLLNDFASPQAIPEWGIVNALRIARFGPAR
jgi:CubicO group peptidase (beta-lactamase class C family)